MSLLQAATLQAAPSSGAPGDSSLFADVGERARLLDGVLSWLQLRLDLFDPPREDQVFGQGPEEIVQDRRRKAFGELGAALRLARRVPALWARPEIQGLAKIWLARARDCRMFFDARRRTQLFPQMAVALAVLEALDPRAAAADRPLLQSVMDRRFMDRIERCAWHKLDQKYYFEAAGLTHGFADDAALLAESSLMAPPALPWATQMDLYGVTHLIFHFTDFGAHPLPAAPGFDAAALDDYVALALSMSLMERDFDLTAELLMSRLCLGRREAPLNHLAAGALLGIQQPDGFVPDRTWVAGETARKDDSATAVEREFFAVYHPTVVTLFLIACDMIPPAAWTRNVRP